MHNSVLKITIYKFFYDIEIIQSAKNYKACHHYSIKNNSKPKFFSFFFYHNLPPKIRKIWTNFSENMKNPNITKLNVTKIDEYSNHFLFLFDL